MNDVVTEEGVWAYAQTLAEVLVEQIESREHPDPWITEQFLEWHTDELD
jgi:hypothetical protein